MSLSGKAGESVTLAWKDWQSTAEYANALQWAKYAVISTATDDGTLRIGHPHTEGSLWGAFAAGYLAGLTHAQALVQGEKPEVQR